MGTKFTQLKTEISQNNWLVFVVFLMYNFHLSFAANTTLYYFVGRQKNYLISSFKLVFTCVFYLLWSCVLVNVIRYGKRMKILLYSVLFCLLKSKINSFLRIQFSQLLSRGKGKNIISCFLTS